MPMQRSLVNAFATGVAERIGYYVYLLIDPRHDAVFYVGKGVGNRCFAHLVEARATQADTVGDYPKLALIREIEDAGAAVQIDILRHGLSEHEAFLVESSAIDLMDLQSLTNYLAGHNSFELGRMSVADINAKYVAEPVEINPKHRVVLIRINRLFERSMTDIELYEATRRWWRIGPGRRQLGMTVAPDWAMAVYGGIVRAVYRIDAWEPAPDHATSRRWGFIGTREHEMEETYLYRDVSSYLRAASGFATQSPVRYVNCG